MELTFQLSDAEQSKGFIDVFMKKFYPRLCKKFRVNNLNINSRSLSSMDILHETVLGVYESSPTFRSQDEANIHLHAKFKNATLVKVERKLRKLEPSNT